MAPNLKKIFKNRYPGSGYYSGVLWLLIVYILCEIIVNPFGDFPLNDDWAYTKALNTLGSSHKINIGTWPAMTLLTQILWGYGFTSVFGFSFFVLRISTLISSFIGLTVLYKIIYQFSGKRSISFFGTAVLLFNPVYFNLSNTFMTDVNFNTLLLLGIYFCLEYFRSKKALALVPVFIVSVLLVLLRQYGLILPLCFLFACVFMCEKKTLSLLIAAFNFIITLVILKYYESFLKEVLSPKAMYKFSGDISLSQRVFWDQFWENLLLRVDSSAIQILFYLSPIAVLLVYQLRSHISIKMVSIASPISLLISYLLLKKGTLQTGNVFSGLSLGAETFLYQLKGIPHNRPFWFESLLPYFTALLCGLSVFYVFILIYIRGFKPMKQSVFQPKGAFLFSLFVGYFFLLISTDSYFDRYHIPLIVIGLIFFCGIHVENPEKRIPPILFIPLIIFAYIAVFGTRDYFTRNRKTWEAYSDIKAIDPKKSQKINAGIEVFFWNEGKEDPALWDFLEPKNFDYIIQYDKPEGFKTFRTYKFQRFCPLTEDGVTVFVREK